MNELVSIVLPTYNGSKYLRQSIDSCLAQTYRNIELIIVDDCSTDETPNIIKSYADPRIKYIRNSENKKLPLSLNVGFSASTGKYLTWTSDDNYFIPAAIEQLESFLTINKDVDFVYSDYFIINERDEVTPVETAPPEELLFRNTVGACFLYKRSIYEVLGGFDNEYFLCEDYEYWVRIYLRKFKLSRTPEKLYYYRKHSNSLTSTTAAARMQTTELKIINKIFSSSFYKNDFVMKRRAICSCYHRTAVLHRESNNFKSTIVCSWLAFCLFPFIVFDIAFFRFVLITLIRIIFQKNVVKK